jgi:hypothetical protein
MNISDEVAHSAHEKSGVSAREVKREFRTKTP